MSQVVVSNFHHDNTYNARECFIVIMELYTIHIICWTSLNQKFDLYLQLLTEISWKRDC